MANRRLDMFSRAAAGLADGRHQEAAGTFRRFLDEYPGVVEARLELARALFLGGEEEAALEELRAFTRETDAYPSAFDNLGAALGSLGRLEEERQAYERAAFLTWKPVEYLVNRGLNALERREYGELEELVAALASRYRADPGGPLLEGFMKEARGDLVGAAASFGVAADRDEGGWIAPYNQGRVLHAAGRGDAAREPLERALERGEPRWEVLLALGNVHLAADRRREATECLEEAMELSPEGEVSAAYNLAVALLGWGNPEKARRLLRAAAERAPEDDAVLSTLGRATILTREFDEAIELYERLIEDNPRNFRAHYHLGMCLERIGQRDRAREMYRKALQRSPTHHKTMNKLARLLAKQGEFDEAVELARRSIEQEPEDNAEAHLMLGIALQGARRPEEARQAFLDASEREPGNHEIWKRLSTVHCLLGDPDAALEAAERAVAQVQDDAEAHLYLGLARQFGGDDPGAIAAFKQVLRLDEALARAYRGIAESYTRLGETERARKYRRLFEKVSR